ncbi:hypothetical protein BDP27DRAFT_1374303 [Rhodocollybia butyracea]|uniref:Uncharacterized protein n=1 Tax=Rhodocollybia butyracea TaxID=206335 RepID=A0A9P5TWR6_9AGAR|nr:hypothetical protein BDP27DRAFT_1374303 [Rhodocollybia butyracea]
MPSDKWKDSIPADYRTLSGNRLGSLWLGSTIVLPGSRFGGCSVDNAYKNLNVTVFWGILYRVGVHYTGIGDNKRREYVPSISLILKQPVVCTVLAVSLLLLLPSGLIPYTKGKEKAAQ